MFKMEEVKNICPHGLKVKPNLLQIAENITWPSVRETDCEIRVKVQKAKYLETSHCLIISYPMTHLRVLDLQNCEKLNMHKKSSKS